MPAYFYIIEIIIIVISFIASVTVYFQKALPRFMRYYPPFLLLAVAVEITAHYMALKYGNNHPLINLFAFASYAFYAFILAQLIQKPVTKKLLYYSSGIYLLAGSAWFLFMGIRVWQSLIFMVGGILILIFCLSYIAELFKDPVSGPLFREPSFWISCGLLYLYGGTLVLLGFNNYLGNFPRDVYQILNYLMLFVNYTYYLMLTIAFLCRLGIKKAGQKT